MSVSSNQEPAMGMPSQPLPSIKTSRANSLTANIVESREPGLVVLSPALQRPRRRVLFVNSYGGSSMWKDIKDGLLPPHHLWGCLELVQMGYEVGLAEPLLHFTYRKPFPHDLPLLQIVRHWLRPDDIIYCGHTLLFWIPLLRAITRIRCHIVSTTYAREDLDFARSHDGIIALTPAAADQAKRMAPMAKVAHLAWGCDLSFFPCLPFNPRWFLSCGITHRDFAALSEGARQSTHPLRLICPGIPPQIEWSSNVHVIDGGKGWNHQKTVVSYKQLFFDHYAGAIASIIALRNDPEERTAIGFTNLLEALALARPVILTRTGAVPGELNVEKAECGIYVPPNDPGAVAKAMKRLFDDPGEAERMGRNGRRMAEKHYNIKRYAEELDRFFSSL